MWGAGQPISLNSKPMKSLLARFVHAFGFDDLADFAGSLLFIRYSDLLFFAALAGSVIQSIFGVHPYVMAGFVVVIGIEVVSGLWASKVKKIKPQSKRWERFGFKLIVYIVGLAVLYWLSFIDDGLISQAFLWIRNLWVTYVGLGYFLSIKENLDVIRGKELPLDFSGMVMSKITGLFGMKPEADDQDEKPKEG